MDFKSFSFEILGENRNGRENGRIKIKLIGRRKEERKWKNHKRKEA